MNHFKTHTELQFHNDINYRKTLVGEGRELPNPINILYNDMMSVKRFLLSMEGEYLVNSAKTTDQKLNFFPSDIYGEALKNGIEITKEFYDTLHNTKNIKIYNTEWYGKFTNYLPATNLIEVMYAMVNELRDINFNDTNKEYHFLTLNNIEKPDRLQLYNFYENNPIVKSYSLSSFIFKNIFLDNVINQARSTTGSKEKIMLYNPATMKDFYSKCAIEIVCESGPNIISEKVLKPLFMGVPFLLHTNGLHNLYSTFDLIGIDINYFGIEYSTKVGGNKNINCERVQNKITELASLDLSELQSKYKSDFKKAQKNKDKILEIWDNLFSEFPNIIQKSSLSLI